jgi:hypothetical protein
MESAAYPRGLHNVRHSLPASEAILPLKVEVGSDKTRVRPYSLREYGIIIPKGLTMKGRKILKEKARR